MHDNRFCFTSRSAFLRLPAWWQNFRKQKSSILGEGDSLRTIFCGVEFRKVWPRKRFHKIMWAVRRREQSNQESATHGKIGQSIWHNRTPTTSNFAHEVANTSVRRLSHQAWAFGWTWKLKTLLVCVKKKYALIPSSWCFSKKKPHVNLNRTEQFPLHPFLTPLDKIVF
jgi:hypothetical protein